MNQEQLADMAIEPITHDGIDAREASVGTARGLLRTMLLTLDAHPEQFRKADRDLRWLVGDVTGMRLWVIAQYNFTRLWRAENLLASGED
jgi:hypothetical protein